MEYLVIVYKNGVGTEVKVGTFEECIGFMGSYQFENSGFWELKTRRLSSRVSKEDAFNYWNWRDEVKNEI